MKLTWRKSALKEIKLFAPDYTFRCETCADLSFDNIDHLIGRVGDFYLNENCETCNGTGIIPIPLSEVW